MCVRDNPHSVDSSSDENCDICMEVKETVYGKFIERDVTADWGRNLREFILLIIRTFFFKSQFQWRTFTRNGVFYVAVMLILLKLKIWIIIPPLTNA